MFERFPDRSRMALALANQESQRFSHEYIGTEHILLALLREGTGVGFDVLKNLGVDPLAMRRELDTLIPSGTESGSPGKLPETSRVERVIVFAIEEARCLNHNYVGTEHLLLGLLQEGEGIAAIILTQPGIQVDAARDEIRRLLESPDLPPDSNSRVFHD